MERVGVADAVLHKCDLRTFHPKQAFDLVASFGLVEHFTNYDEILDHHHRLLRPGGLCLVVVPNFRGLQYLYHRLFDARDLARHNLAVMDPSVFCQFAARREHTILFLGHCGRMRFWNVDLEGSRRSVLVRRLISRAVRELALRIGAVLPDGAPMFAPWLVYLGRRPQ